MAKKKTKEFIVCNVDTQEVKIVEGDDIHAAVKSANGGKGKAIENDGFVFFGSWAGELPS